MSINILSPVLYIVVKTSDRNMPTQFQKYYLIPIFLKNTGF